ncbi:MAG: PilN domain-containing protein [Prosthecobacter sp.]|nr:PilN domain-containing protein [Prosthecobacter sp.]
MSFAASTLLLPSPDATWRVWKPRSTSGGESVETPASVSNQGKPLIVGLPASACRTMGLILPNADHEILEQIIVTQLERKGLKMEMGTRRNFRWHLLTQNASFATVSVDILADPFPQDLALTQASDFTSALRLLTLPNGNLVITEEHGSLVLAANYQGKLYHSHLFAPANAAPDDIAQEISLSRLALEQDLGVGGISGITLVGSTWDRQMSETLTSLTDLPTRVVPHLPPNAELDTRNWTRLLPHSVSEAQTSAARRSKLTRFGILGGLLFIALGFLAFAYLTLQERTAAELETAVEATAQPASQVKKTVERWKSLAPAIEPKRYPMVILAEITKLMPPSGIVIREFNIKDTEIDIRGEARDAQVAVQFVEDLQKHGILGQYKWTKPQPTVREKTAQFRAQGKLQ